MSVKDIIRLLLGIFTGTIMYTPLVLVPFIGPLAAGFATGWIAKTRPQKAFSAGLFSGLLGFLAWDLYIIPAWEIETGYLFWIFWWMFLVWNLLGMILSGVAASLGSAMSSTKEVLSEYGKQNRMRETRYETDPPVYVICKSCGATNPDDSIYCAICNERINT
ncbi:MAG: zinc ribbon domain-containing protein [Candidatus Altiarchaeota archaeon]|nr:zinc ribbon domain-containing protein [Candidatus Altiarchaeota archaeon]